MLRLNGGLKTLRCLSCIDLHQKLSTLWNVLQGRESERGEKERERERTCDMSRSLGNPQCRATVPAKATKGLVQDRVKSVG